jgi:hypothetical protein
MHTTPAKAGCASALPPLLPCRCSPCACSGPERTHSHRCSSDTPSCSPRHIEICDRDGNGLYDQRAGLCLQHERRDPREPVIRAACGGALVRRAAAASGPDRRAAAAEPPALVPAGETRHKRARPRPRTAMTTQASANLNIMIRAARRRARLLRDSARRTRRSRKGPEISSAGPTPRPRRPSAASRLRHGRTTAGSARKAPRSRAKIRPGGGSSTRSTGPPTSRTACRTGRSR